MRKTGNQKRLASLIFVAEEVEIVGKTAKCVSTETLII